IDDRDDEDDAELHLAVINGPALPPAGEPPRAPDDPRQILIQLTRQNPAYAKEYRQQLVGRMLMRNIPIHQIAIQLGVSV
ncbi:hypothetical protein ACXWO5_10825, partial [Streptococcus pyogenes]